MFIATKVKNTKCFEITYVDCRAIIQGEEHVFENYIGRSNQVNTTLFRG